MNRDEILVSINSFGVVAKGKKDLVNHLKGRRLTQQQAIRAKCYDCMGYFADGRVDCDTPSCPLYNFMPYNPKRTKVGMKISVADIAQESNP